MAKFLEEVRAIALQANIRDTQERVLNTISFCKTIIKEDAEKGLYKTNISIGNLLISKDKAHLVVEYFVDQKFNAKLAQIKEPEDSAIGYYINDVIAISWE